MTKPTILHLLLGTVLLELLAACSSPRAVWFTTATQTGLEANAAEAGQQTVHIGYQRLDGVIMPHRDSKGAPLKRAYPVLSFYDFSTGNLTLTNASGGGPLTLRQVFATGPSAANKDVQKLAEKDFKRLQAWKDDFGIQTNAVAQILNAFHARAERQESLLQAAKGLGVVDQNTTTNQFLQKLRRSVEGNDPKRTIALKAMADAATKP